MDSKVISYPRFLLMLLLGWDVPFTVICYCAYESSVDLPSIPFWKFGAVSVDELVQQHLHTLHILHSFSHMKDLSFLTCVGLSAVFYACSFPVAISPGLLECARVRFGVTFLPYFGVIAYWVDDLRVET